MKKQRISTVLEVPAPRHYPSYDLPLISASEVQRLAELNGKTPDDIVALERERDRASRKLGAVRASPEKFAEPEARERSASHTHQVTVSALSPLTRDGANRQAARSAGGKARKEQRMAEGAATRARVIAERDRLLAAGKDPRAVAGIISNNVGKSVSRVRAILAEDKRRFS